MRCEEIRERFADHVTDSLQEPGRSEVEQHLLSCESCRLEAEDLKTIWTRLGSIPAAQPGPELRQRFDVMLEAYKQGLGHAPSAGWWQGVNSWLAGWLPRQPVLQFGFALGLLILGVLAGRWTRPAPVLQSNGEITELRDELYRMRQMVALSLMQQQSASQRLKGVSWSYQLQEPGSELLTALMDTLKHDPNVSVRLAAVDALRQFGEQPVVRRGVVEAIERQEWPMVQMALIDLVVDLREKQSVETLRQLAKNEMVDQAVRERAERGLTELE